MSDSTEAPRGPSTADSRWIWALRGLALVSLLLVAGACLQNASARVVGMPLLVCYLMALFGLGRKPVRGALSLAGITGLLGILATVLPWAARMARGFPEVGWRDTVFVGFFAAVQLGVIASALKLRRLPPSMESGRLRLVWAGALGVLLCLAIAASTALVTRASKDNQEFLRSVDMGFNEGGARDMMGILQIELQGYSVMYENGFPENLAVLEPPPNGRPDCSHAGLQLGAPSSSDRKITELHTTGRTSGYVVRYTPGPPVDTPVSGCPPGVRTYTLSARPVEYGKTGLSSFFVSSQEPQGAIHQTKEDRAATPQDPRTP